MPFRIPARPRNPHSANVFDVSLQEVFSALTTGGSLWLISEVARRDFAELYSLLLDNHIERLFIPYVALEQLSICAIANMAKDGLKLRDIISAGEALILTEPIRKLLDSIPGCRLHNHYGPTESHVVTVYGGNGLSCSATDSVSIGRPIVNTSIYLLDSLGQPCPIGIPGELHIGGAGLARGYLNNPELTAKKFIPNPFSSDSTARLYKSGDLASWNPDGTLAFHGRIDQQIKLRGFRIEPGEIEANLLTHPAVAQAVVVLRNDDPSNLRLIAYWVADASHPTSSSASSEQLSTFLADRLPDYMVPAAFLQLEALPLTANGKLDRQALPAPSFSGNIEQRVAPSTDLERQLHGIWAEVLGHSDFGITDNFFAIGGHSLAAARLLAAIEESFAIALPMATLFHFPEIRLMARRMESTALPSEDVNSCLVPLQPHGESAPLFVIHGYGGDVFCYTDFARALAPDRPVYGLQAMGIDGTSARHRSVEEMAAHYANLIDQQWPSGELHLLGQSAGGWVVCVGGGGRPAASWPQDRHGCHPRQWANGCHSAAVAVVIAVAPHIAATAHAHPAAQPQQATAPSPWLPQGAPSATGQPPEVVSTGDLQPANGAPPMLGDWGRGGGLLRPSAPTLPPHTPAAAGVSLPFQARAGPEASALASHGLQGCGAAPAV